MSESAKNPLQSKTLAANLAALGALYLQHRYGYVVDPEDLAAALAAVNVVLRFVTDKPLKLR
jgi:hypothetical protein